MIDWFKLKSTIATNAKIADAGADGALVYLSVLCQHVHHGVGGRLPIGKVRPKVLRTEACAFLGRMPEKRIASAFDRCVAAELLVVDGESVVVTGYDAGVMPTCVRCRKPNADHRFAVCLPCRTVRNGEDGSRQGAPQVHPGAPRSRQGAADRTGPDRTEGTGRDGTGRSGPADPADPNGGAVPSRSSDAGARADRSPERDDRSSSSGPAGSAGQREVDGRRAELFQALWDGGYRAHAKQRSRDVARAARRLDEAHFDLGDLTDLARIARAKGEDPQGLFAHFVDHLDEAAKELGKRCVGAPRLAASVVAEAAPHAAGGSA